jgi:hypothetical protein
MVMKKCLLLMKDSNCNITIISLNKRLIGLIGSVPHCAKEFVHKDSFESFKEKVIGSIKSQNPASITVQLIYKTDELGGT